ncbi:hypothetical protein ACPUER_35255 [Burkholderia sp. DN3021]|uniref:hypothetical protein n=1 Tax=Burkholderia TaxID=32008 RepID=UPI00158B0EFD|nr:MULTISPECIES: hypothetical protein [Burkholderia cepacia complex]MDR6503631.1 hypothetical protein [Burkholderia ambifaria]
MVLLFDSYVAVFARDSCEIAHASIDHRIGLMVLTGKRAASGSRAEFARPHTKFI